MKRRAKKTGGTKTVAEYLKALPADKRAALARLRKDIRAAAPGVEECISYGMPAFQLHGKFLLGFGAGAKHCAFYPGAHPIAAHKDSLKGYSLSKGTIRFSAENPLPTALVRKLVKARLSEKSDHGGDRR